MAGNLLLYATILLTIYPSSREAYSCGRDFLATQPVLGLSGVDLQAWGRFPQLSTTGSPDEE